MDENRDANRLAAVYQLGQSIWYDNIRRSVITSGELQRLIQEDSIVGVTSNPTIFEKAIDGSSDYDESIRELVGRGIFDGRQIFEELATTDIQMAADVLRPVYDRTGHLDGYISLEVSPDAAHDTHETISQVRHLFHKVDRPNVMIKIPATAEGLPAIEQMIYEGVNINVTLIFALDMYERVAQAYIRGLEHRRKDGLAVDGIASVASFFVSRVDTLVDSLLQAKIQRPRTAICGIGWSLCWARRPLPTPGWPMRGTGRCSMARVRYPRRKGSGHAEVSLGQHQHQEPGLFRRHVRGGSSSARKR